MKHSRRLTRAYSDLTNSFFELSLQNIIPQLKTSCFGKKKSLCYGGSFFMGHNRSDYQHGITIAEEPVFVFNSFLVSLHGKVVTSKGTCHNQ